MVKVCYYCGSKDREMTKDHLVPKAHGGKRGKNIVDACMICNRAKGCMTYAEFINWIKDVNKVHKK
jgi:5-methylcytosine-specific restriction endonuclease McrA